MEKERIKKKFWKRKVFLISIFILLSFIVITGTLYATTYFQGAGSKNVINNALSSNVNRHSVTNSSDSEVLYYDNAGNIQGRGNSTFVGGYFTYIGSSVSRITKGWFTNLDVSYNINSTNVSVIGGNSTAWNSAYIHSIDNTQAHSDYLLNTADSGTGNYIFSGNVTGYSFVNPLVEYNWTSLARTQAPPISTKIFEVYDARASGPTGSYGTLFNIYGRSGHTESQFFFDGSSRRVFYRGAWYLTEYNDWRELLTSATNVNSSGNLLITGAGNHYIKSGNVGIGTITPTSAKLEINTTDGTEQLRLWGTASNERASLIMNSATNQLNISLSAGGTKTLVIQDADPQFMFSTDTITNALTIQNGGNVGIGTNTPTNARLYVTTGNASFSIGSENRFVISDDGTDTNANSSKLSFFGRDYSNNYITGPSIQKVSESSYGRGALAFFQHGGADYTSENEVMRISYNGNVGIGTTSPQNPLNVIGTGNFTSHLYSQGYINSTVDICIQNGNCLSGVIFTAGGNISINSKLYFDNIPRKGSTTIGTPTFSDAKLEAWTNTGYNNATCVYVGGLPPCENPALNYPSATCGTYGNSSTQIQSNIELTYGGNGPCFDQDTQALCESSFVYTVRHTTCNGWTATNN